MNRWIALSLAASLALGCKEKKPEDGGPTASGSAAADAAEAPTSVSIAPATLEAAGVKSVKVSKASLTLHDEMPGTIEAPRDALVVLNTRSAGVVDTLSIDVGDEVKKDQVLATVKSLDLADVQADYQRSAARASHANDVVKRTRELAEKGLLSRKRLEQDEADLKQAHLDVAESSEKIRLLGGTLGDTSGTITIRSPIAGNVASRSANRGQAVAADAALFTVVDLSRVIVEFRCPAGTEVPIGTAVTFRSEALPGKSFDATIKSAGAMLDPETRRYALRGTLAKADAALRPGMFVTGRIPRAHLEALAVPESALLLMGGSSVVFVSLADGRFDRREVTLGARTDGKVVVESGLTDGESVVVEGAFWVRTEMQKSELEE